MKISAKARYGLAAMVILAQNYQADIPITVLNISEKLGLSKIYLEQVFSLLRRAGLVCSIKGAQGGYQLSASPEQLTAYDVLSAIELSLIERTEATVAEKAPGIDQALQKLAFQPLDAALQSALSKVTLLALVEENERCKGEASLMYYI